MFQGEFTVLSRILKQVLWTLLLYTILRLEFLIWNWNQWFSLVPVPTIFKVFIFGWRFDISAVFTIASVVLIAALIPWPFVKTSLKDLTLRTALFILNVPFLIFNMIDIEFVHFTGRRLSSDSLFLTQEVSGKLGAFFSTYWPLFTFNFILLVLYSFICFKWIPRHALQPQDVSSTPRWYKRALISMLFLIVFVIAARGGWQLKPLEMAHTGFWNDLRLSHLMTNSSFSFLHSFKKEKLHRKNDFKTFNEYANLLNSAVSESTPVSTQSTAKLPWKTPPRNVVLFILESFSQEYMGVPNHDQGYTPYLDSLISQSLFFPNAYANGRRSIEALPSLLAGIPSLMDEPFLASSYQSAEIPLLGEILRSQGVQSFFFHGGKNGTMFFDEFISRLKFDRYYGANEYPHNGDNDGTWGIWDEPFLKFMLDELDKNSQKPFLSVFFSLSSHHPFQIPEPYKNLFQEGPLPILKTIRYTDEALKKFMQQAEKSPWFHDTVFIFTADHTSKTFRPENNGHPLGLFKIPMIIYYPQEPLTATHDQPVQQIDVYPTLLDLFQIEQPTSHLTRSLFSLGPRQVPLYLDGDFWLIRENQALWQDKSLKNQVFNLTKDPLLKQPLTEDLISQIQIDDLEKRLKASIQYYNNGILQNSILKPDQKP